MAKLPWYKDGLRFECTGCGNCCTGAPGVVWVTPEEIAALADLVGLTAEEFEAKYVRQVEGRKSLTEFANGDCVFFDNVARRCNVYPARPVQCRTWPFWNSNLERPSDWKYVLGVCPGSGQGQLHTLEEIQARAAEIRI